MWKKPYVTGRVHEIYCGKKNKKEIEISFFDKISNENKIFVIRKHKIRGRRQSIFIFFNGIVPLRRGGGGDVLKLAEKKWKST